MAKSSRLCQSDGASMAQATTHVFAMRTLRTQMEPSRSSIRTRPTNITSSRMSKRRRAAGTWDSMRQATASTSSQPSSVPLPRNRLQRIRDDLVAAVRARVRELKKQGQPPEKVIVTIKRQCGLPLITFAADTDASTDGSARRQIAELVVRAVIDEYYSGRTDADRAALFGR